MRLWSLHPKYLDRQGLLAVWREGLLAQKVLLGETKGYKNHSQLERFKKYISPLGAIHCYLHNIWKEARGRQYNFNYAKIGLYFDRPSYQEKLTVTKGQLEYEFEHLQKKLEKRDNFKRLENNRFTNCAIYYQSSTNLESHPLFKVIEGDIESWEKIKRRTYDNKIN